MRRERPLITEWKWLGLSRVWVDFDLPGDPPREPWWGWYPRLPFVIEVLTGWQKIVLSREHDHSRRELLLYLERVTFCKPSQRRILCRRTLSATGEVA